LYIRLPKRASPAFDSTVANAAKQADCRQLFKATNEIQRERLLMKQSFKT